MPKRALAVVFVALVFVLCQGCMGIDYASRVGRHKYELRATHIYELDDGAVVVRAGVEDRMRWSPGEIETRYLVANPETAIRSGLLPMLRKNYPKPGVKGYSHFEAELVTPLFGCSSRPFLVPDGWCIFPDARPGEQSEVPTEIRDAVATRSARYVFGPNYLWINLPEGRKEEPWGPYVRPLLYVPAFVIDVVTFPVQFLYVFFKLP